jgi:hypothetical protein
MPDLLVHMGSVDTDRRTRIAARRRPADAGRIDLEAAAQLGTR